MRNTLNKLRLILITSICLIISMIVAACSSGGSGSTEGLNISGRWSGNLVDSRNLGVDDDGDPSGGRTSWSIVFDFAQTDTVGVPGNARIADVIWAYTITGVADTEGDDDTAQTCIGATQSGDSGQINSEINPATFNADGITAVVIDNKIIGTFADPDLGCGYGGQCTIMSVTSY